jgi:hypothetical protein
VLLGEPRRHRLRRVRIIPQRQQLILTGLSEHGTRMIVLEPVLEAAEARAAGRRSLVMHRHSELGQMVGREQHDRGPTRPQRGCLGRARQHGHGDHYRDHQIPQRMVDLHDRLRPGTTRHDQITLAHADVRWSLCPRLADPAHLMITCRDGNERDRRKSSSTTSVAMPCIDNEQGDHPANADRGGDQQVQNYSSLLCQNYRADWEFMSPTATAETTSGGSGTTAPGIATPMRQGATERCLSPFMVSAYNYNCTIQVRQPSNDGRLRKWQRRQHGGPSDPVTGHRVS